MDILRDRKIYQGKYFKLFEREYFDSKRQKRNWECVERKDGVFVFALTKNKEVILERIFRVAVGSFVFELPAGTCDREEETVEQTAERELLEETGYKPNQLISVFKSPLDPGILTNEGYLFFAPRVDFVKNPMKEDCEEIEIYKVPLSNFFEFLDNSHTKGTKVDIKVFGAFYVLQQKGFF